MSVEIFVTSSGGNGDELRERVRFFKRHGFVSFHLSSRKIRRQSPQQEQLFQDAMATIREEIPHATICTPTSWKENGNNAVDTSLLPVLETNGKAPGSSSTTLMMRKDDKETMSWGVTYSPFLSRDVDQAKEDLKLEQCMASGDISQVYIPFGTDLYRLKSTLHKITSTTQNATVVASLLLPTLQVLQSQQRQQSGKNGRSFHLNRDFLHSTKSAEDIVVNVIQLLNEYHAEMVWCPGPSIRTDEDIRLMMALIDRSKQTIVTKKEIENPSSLSDVESQPILRIPPPPPPPCILLFGSHDVRLHDNHALQNAAIHHRQIIPIFLWTKQSEWGVRGALEVVLQEALQSLEAAWAAHGIKLLCFNCSSTDGLSELRHIVQETNVNSVYWNKEHTPESRELEGHRRQLLLKMGIQVFEAQSSLLYDPDEVDLRAGFEGGHWGTLMPFLIECKRRHGHPRRPIPVHETFSLLQNLESIPSVPHNAVSVEELNMAVISGKDQWDIPIRRRFPMSEDSAKACLDSFFRHGLRIYEKDRSLADTIHATSQLSPHLRVGTVSPIELYWRIESSNLDDALLNTFSRRLFWRELAYYQLKCFPKMRNEPIRAHYGSMEWVSGEEERRRLEAWKKGKTGYPIVDAGMRELYETGWMTQSVRMVVAAFFVEYLRINWVRGCEWFHYTLVDCDSAINAMMWQNAGKSGTDQWNFVPSPKSGYQDPSGNYTRKWVPELATLPTPGMVHRPWESQEDVLKSFGVVLGETYPNRIITDLNAERVLSSKSTVTMRRHSQHANSDHGYDLIQLPSGEETVVFTKKEYRIDKNGQPLSKLVGAGGVRRRKKSKV